MNNVILFTFFLKRNNMYTIKKLSDSPSGIFAFAVNPSNFEIVLGRSGHNTILRSYDKRDFCEGGWVDIKSKKLILNCGSLANVKDHVVVKRSLENFFGVNFNYVR